MHEIPPLIWPAGVAASVFALLAYLLCSGLGVGLAADHPNHRSLHTQVTPRIGGLVAIPLALGATLLLNPGEWLVPSIALTLAAISFMDDRHDLPAAWRFGAHIVAAAIIVCSIDIPLVWRVVLCFAIVWSTNLYNFMDGADGLAGGMGLAGFGAYAWAAWSSAPDLAWLSLLLIAALIAFLCFNFAPARVFMGDAGSIPLGFLAGTVGVLGWHRGIWPWWFPALAFSTFWIDATVTLLRRALQKKKVWQAHREHYYQRLVQMGWSHRRLAVCEYLCMAASSILALILLDSNDIVQVVGIVAVLLAYAVLILAIDLRWKSFND